ncbi:RNA polymerase sigma factor [bacterium]|nr:RNA polymerase sigma factor [bacterium]
MIGAFRFWRKRGPCDREECEKLLAAQYKPIYAYLRRCCGNTDDAQDLTQETFAKVWKALLAQPRAGNLRAWIYCIARNTWLDSARKRGRMETRSDAWWENLPAPEQTKNAMAEREIAAILAQKVHELDDEKREAIILHYYQGLTLRETAEVLGVAASTVKYRLREAIQILREQMEKDTPRPDIRELKKESACHEPE